MIVIFVFRAIEIAWRERKGKERERGKTRQMISW